MMAADAGIRVVSISIAGSSASSTLANAVSYAWNKGTVVFASAGNYNTNTPYYPAATPYVVSVGATNASDTRSSYSNYGSWVTLFAPGDSILTTVNGGGYGYVSGTSFSAPIAAGVAALVLSKNPSLTAQQLVDVLKNNTDDLGDPGFDNVYGWGRVNAFKAVSAAGGSTPADQTAPTAAITSPASGSTVSGTVSVAVTASDNVAVTKVEMWAGSTLVGSKSAAPYNFNWNTSGFSGAVTLTAKAFDAAGNTGTGSVTVTVEAPPDTVNPVASIIAPAAGSSVSGTVTVSVSASDNVAVTKVEFWAGSTLAGTRTASPYNFNWDTASYSGSVTLTAKAFDAAGNTGTASVSVNITLPPAEDTTAPVVSFTAPASGATITAATTVSASATDNVGVTKVEFYAGASLIYTDTSAPYSFSFNPSSHPNGPLTLTARAYDAKNNVGQTTRSVTVQNSTSGGEDSTVSVTSPTSGTVVAGVVTISTSVTTSAKVRRVEFYVDNTLIGTRTSAPYSLSWDSKKVADGNKSLRVKLVTTANQSSNSLPVPVTISNATGADSIPPSVSFVSPRNGDTVGNVVSAQVAAADNIGVTQVELYADGKLVGTSTSAPYAFTVRTAGNGDTVLLAKAYDSSGNTSTATITVRRR
jgi:hypothetical protein